MRQLLELSSKCEDHFLNSLSTLLQLHRNLICLSRHELLTNLRMFENQCRSLSGQRLNYHLLYKCTKEKNISFSSLVNLQMEFSVVRTFSLIPEGRFSLVLIPQIFLPQQN